MNKRKSDQDNNKKKEPQISVELDDGVIELPLSTFNDILDREVSNFLENQTNKKEDIIELNDSVNDDWKKKYQILESHYSNLNSFINKLESDLKTNKSAQSMRCLSASVGQFVEVSLNRKRKMAMVSKEKYQTCIISDSEDDLDKITDTSKIKPTQIKNDNIIDSVDLDNNTQNLEDKCKPASKSKINVSIPDLKTNDNNKVLLINNEAGKTLSNGEYLSTTIRKRKPGPKSNTMSFSDMVSYNAKNEKTVEKKKRLNKCEVINNKQSNTVKLLSSNSVKKSEKDKYIFKKSSNLKYPPPYPLVKPHNSKPSWKKVPPIPNMIISTSGNKVTLTWDLDLTSQTAKIKMYELYVCQETDAPPNISMWKKKGNIKADLLPMTCELKVFDLGYIYHFALRAVDVHGRQAPFIVLETKI
ncbi:hypothetical protein QTP88_019040 [Uroleucon formosanum]